MAKRTHPRNVADGNWPLDIDLAQVNGRAQNAAGAIEQGRGVSHEAIASALDVPRLLVQVERAKLLLENILNRDIDWTIETLQTCAYACWSDMQVLARDARENRGG